MKIVTFLAIASRFFVLLLSTRLNTGLVVSAQECVDDPDYRLNNVAKKNCKWIGNINRITKNCKKAGAQNNCPVTCGVCCTDNDETLCKEYKTNKFTNCKNSIISILCPKMCGVCCFDDASYTFNKKGGDRSLKKCSWIKNKKRRKKNCKGKTKLKCGEACGKKGCFTPMITPTPNPTSSSQNELTFPPIIDNAVNGVLDMELTHMYTNFSSSVFSMTNARLLNGILPGPTIKVNAGDTLRILYKNEMEDQGLPVGELNTFRYMDYTNLHFHGGHLSGDLPSDDIRLNIPPGSSYQFETKFPESHLPGTHWVHPHVHGSAALHVSNGAALALIVKDPPNYLPPVIDTAEEILMVIQDFDLRRTEGIAAEMGDKKFGFGPGADGREEYFRTVNGQYRPHVNIRPNQWMRWRVIYAGHHTRALDLKIWGQGGKCEMFLLAKDGIYIQDFPRSITSAPVPTGGRADMMVRCTTSGSYSVTTYDDSASTPTLTIEVHGFALPPTSLPAWTPTYPPYLSNLLFTPPDPDRTCDTHFAECSFVQPEDPFLGCINDMPFAYDKSIHSIEMGRVVERTSNVRTHPYHQHVYPVQLVGFSKDDQPGVTADSLKYFKVGDWHDVIQIQGLDGDVEMRFHPKEHLGLLMVHCHRLSHEDRGMMSWEYVYDSGDGVCDCDVRLPPTVISDMPSSSYNQYIIMDTGTNWCADGFEMMTLSRNCEAFAKNAEDLSFIEVVISGEIPKGCFVFAGDEVYFNGHQDGSANDDASPICQPIASP